MSSLSTIKYNTIESLKFGILPSKNVVKFLCLSTHLNPFRCNDNGKQLKVIGRVFSTFFSLFTLIVY